MIKSKFILVLMLFLSVGMSAQKKQTSPAVQTGKATYYSKKSTGRRTASGEKLHHDSLTCAHRTHPFGTLLKVKNLSNDKEVIVRVTDRGPYGKGKIIDLSWGAAKELGMLAKGVQMVEVTVYHPDSQIPYRIENGDELPELDYATDTYKPKSNFNFNEKDEEEEADQDKNAKKDEVKSKTTTSKKKSIKKNKKKTNSKKKKKHEKKSSTRKHNSRSKRSSHK